jgi:TPR repeat protein
MGELKRSCRLTGILISIFDLTAMNEKRDFALARRPSSAVEKTTPGAKRIKAMIISEVLEVAHKKEISNIDAELQNWFQQGKNFYFGREVPQNYSKAVSCFRVAAERGHVKAQYNLAVCYSHGRGVSRDDDEAIKWLRKAAEQNYTNAQYSLGVDFYDILADTEKVKWLQKAAEAGHADAQNELGLSYAVGDGVPKDYVEAAKWLRKAADQGHVEAQANLDSLKD